jgi:hypothetical protein
MTFDGFSDVGEASLTCGVCGSPFPDGFVRVIDGSWICRLAVADQTFHCRVRFGFAAIPCEGGGNCRKQAKYELREQGETKVRRLCETCVHFEVYDECHNDVWDE